MRKAEESSWLQLIEMYKYDFFFIPGLIINLIIKKRLLKVFFADPTTAS